jgi:hypothetical protein
LGFGEKIAHVWRDKVKKLLAAVALFSVLLPCRAANEGKRAHVVLPNPKLMKCRSAECFPLWPEKSADPGAIFPKQLRIDMEQGCLYGISALYDKSMPADDVKAAIDASFGTWAYADSANSPVKLWRVTPDKFAIQLSVAGQFDEQTNFAEAGTKVVAYLAFEGKSACGK